MEEQPAPGELIIARAFGDEARICRLIRICTSTVYITYNKGLYQCHISEDSANVVIFQIYDVYLYKALSD